MAAQPLTPTEQVLRASLSSLSVFDVKFFLYSKRLSTRTAQNEWTTQVGAPRTVLAAGSVLQGVDYFKGLLSGGFAESAGGTGAAADERTSAEEFGYESDSDLEDDEEDAPVHDRRRDGGYDTITDRPSTMASAEAAAKLQENVSELSLKETGAPRDTGREAQSPLYLSHSILDDKRRQIFVKDVAYKTWRAFVFYLYTGKYNFAPLRSSGQLNELGIDDPTSIPLCSPKSMYRLAEKYGVTALQQLAFEGIKSGITPVNVVQELTSKFTSRYDEIRDFELQYLCSNYFAKEVTSAMPGMIARLANGELAHSSNIIALLLTERVYPRQ